MFIKTENGNIIAVSNKKFDDGYKETDKQVVQGFDHKYYFVEDTKTEEYLRRKKDYEKAMQTRHRITELKTLLANYDYIGTKIATGRATKEEYATEIQQMIEWANEINQLEGDL